MKNADSRAWDIVLSIPPKDLMKFYQETDELSDLHRQIYERFLVNGRFACVHHEFFFYSDAAEQQADALHVQKPTETQPASYRK
ncbi:hypothetical protein [Ruegeria sp. HKCCD7318]|uniref:hypothetical protein n=1 Tax=Ruegeria sp. HKCCD7318 TaxID=2683014 RepID=UPI0014913C49|nr:hypothetical protein [Ruegeria sp. HKCCD7318]NOE36483.1 hypothetical protein [Ruegeria sp. HKCCD7318]